jgi:hypothetical protein
LRLVAARGGDANEFAGDGGVGRARAGLVSSVNAGVTFLLSHAGDVRERTGRRKDDDQKSRR